MFNLLPKDTVFFDLFENLVQHVVASAKQLQKLVVEFPKIEASLQMIRNEEHAADDLAHQALDRLDRTFITPFDREDIYELCSRLDDVIDLIDAAASRFVLYRVDSVRTGTLDLVKVLVSATAEVELAVAALERPQEALKHCIEINRYENDSDRLCRTLIAQLFDEEKDPVQIIKWKEIFEVIETAVDKCEDVANVIEGVILKSA